jgi:hypothetical protein
MILCVAIVVLGIRLGAKAKARRTLGHPQLIQQRAVKGLVPDDGSYPQFESPLRHSSGRVRPLSAYRSFEHASYSGCDME